MFICVARNYRAASLSAGAPDTMETRSVSMVFRLGVPRRGDRQTPETHAEDVSDAIADGPHSKTLSAAKQVTMFFIGRRP